MSRTRPTIVLIHGLWMTPRIWGRFVRYYEGRGYRVHAPPWPGLSGEVEDVRRGLSALCGLGLREVTDHYERFVRALPEPPVIIGHSTGALVARLLLDRGCGSAGVAIAPPAPWDVWRWFSTLLCNPLNYWRAVSLSFEQFHSAFANVMPEGEARAAYERDVIPGSGRLLFQLAAANLNPWAPGRANGPGNARAPLLLVAGTDDRLSPPAAVRSTFDGDARSAAVTAYQEFPHRSHFSIAQDGWREIAGHALDWCEAQFADRARGERPEETHIPVEESEEPPTDSRVGPGQEMCQAGNFCSATSN